MENIINYVWLLICLYLLGDSDSEFSLDIIVILFLFRIGRKSGGKHNTNLRMGKQQDYHVIV